MTIEFKESIFMNGLKDILIRDEKKLLKIFYGDNGDLYFDIFGTRSIDDNGFCTVAFIINQNEEIYPYFNQLINNVKDCKVFEICGNKSEISDWNDDVSYGLIDFKKENEKLKTGQKYKKLVHNGTIIWYSDNIYDEKANILRIERNVNGIKLVFIDNPDDPCFGFGIRICNSSSKYDPFNNCFMQLFNQFQLLAKESPIRKLVKPEIVVNNNRTN